MDPETRPPLAAPEDIARLIDHSLLRPDLTAAQVLEGIAAARQCQVASVTVRPCDIEAAVRHLAGSSVKPGSVVGFPHGSQTTPTKLYEARDLLRRGAREIDLTIALAALLSREFQLVQSELSQICEACHKEGATLKVDLASGYLTDELKIIACRSAERAEVDFVSGRAADAALLRKYLPEEIGVKAAEVSDLDTLLSAYESGCTRFGATATREILQAFQARRATS